MFLKESEGNGVTKQVNIEFQPIFNIKPNPLNYQDRVAKVDPKLYQEILYLKEVNSKYKPAIFIVNQDQEIIFWDNQCEYLTGIPAIDIIGTTDHRKLFSPKSPLQLVDIVQMNDLRLMRQHFPNVKISNILTDGFRIRQWVPNLNEKTRFLEIHAGPITNHNTESLGAIQIIMDKTEQALIRKHKSIQSTEDRWFNSFKNVPVITFNAEGRIQRSNESARMLLQLNYLDATSLFFQDLLIDDDEVNHFESQIEAITLTQQSTLPSLWNLRTPLGEEKFLNCYLFPFSSDKKSPEIGCLFIDNTRYKQTKHQLKVTEQKYSTLFQHSTDFLATISFDGKIATINKAFADFLGSPIEKLKNKSIREIVSRSELHLLLKYFRKIYEGRAINGIKFKYMRPTGAWAYLQLKLRILENKNQPPVILVIAHDSTVQRKLERDLHESYRQVIHSLVSFIEMKDDYTGQHSQRLVHDCLYLADLMGLSQNKQKDLEVAAILHDVGKIKIPKSILEKFGTLSEHEKEILQSHAEIGAKAVEKIPRFYRISKIIKYHHERYDGNGYPEGLIGEQIPCEARILAIVDAFDAMMSDRPYRKSLGISVAMKELLIGKGIQFDPNIVDHYLEYIKRKYHVDDHGKPDYLTVKLY